MSWICKKKSIFFGLDNIFSSLAINQPSGVMSPTWSWLSPAKAELRFSVTSSQLNEIVHRLLASPFSVYNPQLVAAQRRKLPHPSLLVCFALLSHFGGSPSPPPPLPHLTLSFSFYLLRFLLLGCAADFSVRCWTLTPERFASFTQTCGGKHGNQSVDDKAVVSVDVLMSGGFLAAHLSLEHSVVSPSPLHHRTRTLLCP